MSAGSPQQLMAAASAVNDDVDAPLGLGDAVHFLVAAGDHPAEKRGRFLHSSGLRSLIVVDAVPGASEGTLEITLFM